MTNWQTYRHTKSPHNVPCRALIMSSICIPPWHSMQQCLNTIRTASPRSTCSQKRQKAQQCAKHMLFRKTLGFEGKAKHPTQIAHTRSLLVNGMCVTATEGGPSVPGRASPPCSLSFGCTWLPWQPDLGLTCRFPGKFCRWSSPPFQKKKGTATHAPQNDQRDQAIL